RFVHGLRTSRHPSGDVCSRYCAPIAHQHHCWITREGWPVLLLRCFFLLRQYDGNAGVCFLGRGGQDNSDLRRSEARDLQPPHEDEKETDTTDRVNRTRKLPMVWSCDRPARLRGGAQGFS